LATPNYGYEKRQRELAKKKKKEEKLKAKAAGRRPDDSDAPEGDDARSPDQPGDSSTAGEGSGSAD
jgi:hypothetical protein